MHLQDKQEYWWTYICDRKSQTLLTAPYYVTNLVDQQEVQLKFTAPRWAGVFVFTVCLRSGDACNFVLVRMFTDIKFTFRLLSRLRSTARPKIRR